MQEELIAELSSERNRLRLAVVEQERSQRQANGTAAAAPSTTAVGGRSMRSSAALGEGDAPTNAYSKEYPYSRSLANGTSAMGSSSSGGTTKKRSGAAPSLEHVLPENSMRYLTD